MLNHEETDKRMNFHTTMCNEAVVIAAKDTNVFILLSTFYVS